MIEAQTRTIHGDLFKHFVDLIESGEEIEEIPSQLKNRKDFYGNTLLTYATWRGRDTLSRMMVDLGYRKDMKNRFGYAPEDAPITKIQALFDQGVFKPIYPPLFDRVKSEALYGKTPSPHPDTEKQLEDLLDKTQFPALKKKTLINSTRYEADKKRILKLFKRGQLENLILTALERGLTWAALHLDSLFRSSCLNTLYFEAAKKAEARNLTQLFVAFRDVGVELSCTNEHGCTPLHIVCRWGKQDSAIALIQAGADINPISSNGETPLQLAIESEHFDLARKLIRLGADTSSMEGKAISALHAAATAGNSTLVKELIESGSEVDERDPDGRTPLHTAFTLEGLEIISILIRAGANPKAVDYEGNTLAHFASQSRFREGLVFCLESEINMDARNQKGASPLHISAKHGRVDNFDFLLSQAVEADPRDQEGRSVLHYGVLSNSTRLVAYLREKSYALETKDTAGQTPLHIATSKGKNSSIKELIAHGVKLNTRCKHNKTPLHVAVLQSKYKAIELLVEAGADINCMGEHEALPITLAIRNGNAESVELLIKLGADLYKTTKKSQGSLAFATQCESDQIFDALLSKCDPEKVCGESPLITAMRSQKKLRAEALIERGYPLNVPDGKEQIPLMYALEIGHSAFILLLLQKGADPNIVDKEGRSVFSKLIKRTKPDFVETIYKGLIDAGALPDLQDSQGMSALHYASGLSHEGGIKCVLTQKVNLNLQDNQGRTALHITVLQGAPNSITQKLLESGAESDIYDVSGYRPIHYACMLKQKERALLFVSDIESPDKTKGRTPLHISSEMGDIDAVSALLEQGANPKCVDREGRTPLHLAAEKGHQKVCAILLDRGANPAVGDVYGKIPRLPT